MWGIYKEFKNRKGLSQRALSQISGVSFPEISRLETGTRKKTPVTLKALYKYLGVSYEELLHRAGYTEKAAPNQDFYKIYSRDENGFFVDIAEWAKNFYERDSEWANLAYRVVSSGLTDEEIEVIRVVVEALLEQFLKRKKK